jgi:hypothetical protein
MSSVLLRSVTLNCLLALYSIKPPEKFHMLQVSNFIIKFLVRCHFSKPPFEIFTLTF